MTNTIDITQFREGNRYEAKLAKRGLVLPKRNLDKNKKANKVYNTQRRHTLWRKESSTARRKNRQLS